MSAPTKGLAQLADRFDRPVRDCSDIIRYCQDPEYRAAMEVERAEIIRQHTREFDERLARNAPRKWSDDE